MTLLVYKSSAGSGKTYTLVRTYLGLLLRNPSSYRNILGVTFTNKAANEMKSRIIAALEGIASVNPMQSDRYSSLLEELCNETELDKATVKNRAAAALTELLHHYGDFSISTIDSFVHKLVRTFTFDLGLPQQFDVELNAYRLIDKSIENLLSRVGSDELVTHAILDLLVYTLEDGRSWQIEMQLKEFGMNLLEEKSYLHARNLANCSYSDFKEFRHRIKNYCDDFETRLRKQARIILDFFDAEMILESDLAGGSPRSINKFFQLLIEGDVEKAFELKSWGAYLESGKWFSTKATATAKAAINSNHQMLHDTLNDIVGYHEEHSGLYYLAKMLLPQIYKVALLSAIQRSLTEIMDEYNLVHISEFNKRISNIVSGVTAPYIYERLGERYKHFMIDEFQDTSFMQWLNFLPLIDNSLAIGNLNLLVGDGKQAIYRWRNGDVEQFVRLPLLSNPENDPWIEDVGVNLMNHYDERFLNTNFRSSATIVSFNNSFFEFSKQFLEHDMQRVYDGQQQKSVHNADGYIEIQFLPSDEPDKKQAYLLRTLQLIQHLVEEGYTKSDITILVRKNEEGSLLARYLLENNISVISAESLLVSSSPHVKAVMAAMSWIANPSDDVARNDFFYFTSHCRQGRQCMWADFIITEARSRRTAGAAAGLQPFDDDTLAHLSSSSLYDMLEMVLRLLEFDELSDPYIQFLLEYVHEFSVSSKGALHELVEDWKITSKSLSVLIPEATDSVRIMTIHKAKGLEFRVVIFPFANEKLKNCSKSNLWVNLDNKAFGNISSAYITCSKKLNKTLLKPVFLEETKRSELDLLNLVYVAFTRAIDRLYIISESVLPSSDVLSLPGLLTGYIQENNLKPDSFNRYCIGETGPPRKSETARPLVKALGMTSHDWSKNSIFITGNRHEETEPQSQNNRIKGILIHELLSKIPNEDMIEPVLNHYVFNGRISSSEMPELQQMLGEFFALDVISESIKTGAVVHNERELIATDGEVLRPDRVIEFADRVVLIDFKTGEERKEHLIQVENYARTLSTIYPKPVESYLLYLNNDINLVAC